MTTAARLCGAPPTFGEAAEALCAQSTRMSQAEVACAPLASLELINRGETGPEVDDVIHPASVNHRSSGRAPGGRDGFRQVVRWLNAGFADLSITPQDVISQDDKVAVRTHFRGLHVGRFQGVEPTNRTVQFEQIHMFRIENGLVAEHWMCMDELAALRQIGVTVPGQAEREAAQ